MKTNGEFTVYMPGNKRALQMSETSLVVKAVIGLNANFVLKIQ